MDFPVLGAVSVESLCLPSGRSRLQLPTWLTRTSVGLAGLPWLSSDKAPETSAQPPVDASDIWLARDESPPLSFRLFADNQQFVDDIRVLLLRIMDVLRRMVCKVDGAIGAMRLIRLAVRNGLRRRPNVLAFVLIILAACRHYGHRSESDRNSFLLKRRLLVSIGSCPQT